MSTTTMLSLCCVLLPCGCERKPTTLPAKLAPYPSTNTYPVVTNGTIMVSDAPIRQVWFVTIPGVAVSFKVLARNRYNAMLGIHPTVWSEAEYMDLTNTLGAEQALTTNIVDWTGGQP